MVYKHHLESSLSYFEIMFATFEVCGGHGRNTMILTPPPLADDPALGGTRVPEVVWSDAATKYHFSTVKWVMFGKL